MTEVSWPVDLHAHSTFSDGELDPVALVHLAARRGVRVLALTDHDTMAGVASAHEAAVAQGIELVPGVEMTVWHRHEVHLLAYFIDPDDAAFARLLEVRSASRRDRVREIAARLETLGAPIDADAVLAACKDGNVGRPHLARALIAAGHCHDANEAFDRFLGRDGRAYVPASHLPIAEAMDAVHQAGGVAVLAHPGVEKIDESLPELAGLGLDGLEAHHPAHGFADTARYLGVCQLYGLKATGGADFHGHPGAAPPGAFGISVPGFEALRNLRPSGRPASTVVESGS